MTDERFSIEAALGSDQLQGAQYLSFRARDERYALPIDMVREIIEYSALTIVPMMPAFVRGVINLRGHVVPVIDLACRFGQALTRPGKRTCIIILEVRGDDGALTFGLMVDAVDSVFDIDGGIEPAPRFGSGLRTDFIAGMVRDERGFTIILNIDNVLSVDDMKRIGDVANQSQTVDACSMEASEEMA
ncbi:chemotaxis protein CheW [Marinobacter sp. NFXS9]|uniref:chemotaxis protein CheW n=1 Tax=Marinobacter sp. NFXS9 TaxID=2818433 RepID=UPI0032DE4965